MLGEICAAEGIQLTPLSDHWVLRLEKAGRVRHVYGYNFESNSATAQLIAGDKFATWSLLSHCGIPVIPHALFQRPSLGSGPAIPLKVRAAIGDFFKTHGQDVVGKINPGSGGHHVLRARSQTELDSAIEKLFSETRSICLSPFVEIHNEYRVVYHDQPRLIFRKDRPCAIGDGQTPLGELIDRHGPPLPGLVAADLDPNRVPAEGEKVWLGWKHNLAQGARASLDISLERVARLAALAQRAASALGIRFASIDIIETAAGDAVLEVNSGIMLESFARQGEREAALAYQIYKLAVKDLME